jgi:hypothetical protein
MVGVVAHDVSTMININVCVHSTSSHVGCEEASSVVAAEIDIVISLLMLRQFQ